MYFKYTYSRLLKCFNFIRKYSNAPPSKIRNIGIIAHIDAGKTTTTESMLYHAGAIKRMGHVDSGNTVTDFLPSERARGITVQSAAVGFTWNDTFINLIDTPGHVDFTVEVERALHVIDGAVAVLDASRGVEAQTRTVWRQADKLQIPRIAFVNKMDKLGADYAATIHSLQQSLAANTFILQFPIMKNGFIGIVDIINLTITNWDDLKNPENVSTKKLTHNDNVFWEHCCTLRQKLIEQLSELYDDVADLYLSNYSENVMNFPNNELVKYLTHAVRNHSAVPVLCGSSLKDVGVTGLLNAAIDYLPSPEESNSKLSVNNKGTLIGYAFKVVHHKRYGPIVFARILSGKLNAGSNIHNASKDQSEHITQLFTVFADEYKPTLVVSEGHIAAIAGLKITSTGDTLLDKKKTDFKVLAPVKIHQPVFFCTIEADSPTEEKTLNLCLGIISREDPSIIIKRDPNSGQTILCGMGELHMEVLIERIKKEFKTNCYIGPLQVAYREQPLKRVKLPLTYERTIMDKKYRMNMLLTIEPDLAVQDIRILTGSLHLPPEIRTAVKDGISQACQSGAILGFPLMHAKITAQKFEMASHAPTTVITAAAVTMTTNLIEQTDCCILEPMMKICVVTNDEKLAKVLGILAQKHADISEISGDGTDKFVMARAPVAEMLGFASQLRSVTSGDADLTLEIAGYEEVKSENVEALKHRLLGQET